MTGVNSLHGQSISVNLGSERTENQPGGITSVVDEAGKLTGALPVDGTVWNNVSGAGGTASGLIDSTGAATVGSLTWSSANTWYTGSTGATATSENGDLTNGYLDDGGPGWAVSMESPYLLNNIYMITSTDSTSLMPISVNGTYYKGNGAGGTVLAAGVDDPYPVSGFSTADTLIESDNFIKVLGQPAVSLAADRGSQRAAIAGIQVENAYSGTLSYWDANGAADGSGDLGGPWSGATWSTDSAGLSATSTWTSGHAAVFSAGADAVGPSTVTLTGTEVVDAIWLQEGDIAISGGTLDLTAGIGLLRADGINLLEIDSILSAGDAALVGNIDLNNAANTFTGKVTAAGVTTLNADQTFPELGGAGIINLDLATTTLTVGNANDSSFGGGFENDGTVTKVGTGTLTLSGVSPDFFGILDITDGAVNLAGSGNLDWEIAGTGDLIKSGGGQTTMTFQPTYTGDLSIDGGTLAYNLPAGTIDGKTITLGTSARLRQAGSAATDTLTVTNTTIGTTTADGILDSRGGDLVLGTGTTAQVTQIAAGNGNVVIEDGANITTRYFNIGDGGGTSGIINQTGGTVTMEAGFAGIRIGHWSGAGREYNLTGGTLDATALGSNGGEAAFVNMGWDGEGDMTVGGDVNPALLKAPGLRFDRNRAGTGSSASTLTISPNGTVEVGVGGTQGQGTDDGIIMNGGTIIGTASASWGADLDAATATASTIEVNSGVAVTQTRDFGGDGALTKTGDGTLAVNTGVLGSYVGDFSVAGGTLQVAGESIGTGLVTVQAGGSIQGGSPAAAGIGTVDSLTLAAGSSSTFRIGGATSDQLVIFTSDAFTTGTGSSVVLLPVTTLNVGDTFTLIDYDGTIQGSGFAGLSLSSANPHYGFTLVDNTANTSVDVLVDSFTEITWTGSNSNEWDLNTTMNFDDGGSSNFYELDVVNFNDLGAAESVVLTGNISPALVKLNNTAATTYTFSGDSIMGSGGIVKTGSGTAIFTNDNSFTGQVDIQGGAIQIGDGGTTGSFGGTSGIVIAPGAELIIDRSDDLTFAQLLTGGGLLVKNGSNNLTNTTSGNDVDIEVNGGTFLARGGGWPNGVIPGKTLTINTGATLDTTVHSLGGIGAGIAQLPGLVHLNGGSWFFNNEQYVNGLEMTGGMTSGPGEIRTWSGTGDWVINPTAGGSVMGVRINNVRANTIQVADGAAAVDFLVSGNIVGEQGITKSGPGVMTCEGIVSSAVGFTVSEGRLNLLGANTNTGDNEVADGAVLEMGQATLDDASTLTIGATGQVILSHGAADIIDILIIDGAIQAPGTYGATGSGATNINDTNFSGTGVLQVEGGDDYTVWGSAQTWTFGAAGTGRTEDFDGDGYSNEFEYTFGMDPTVASASPIVAPLDKGGLTFSYTRRNPALSGLVFSAETSTDLVDFTPDTGATELVTGTVGDVQTVEVTLSVTADDKLFARAVGATIVVAP